MEDEVRHILRDAAKHERRVATQLESRIASRFKSAGLETDLPELHQLLQAAEFRQ